MAFDQPVFIDPNNILVQSRQEILEKDIERLKKWGILEVETNGKPLGSAADGGVPAGGAAPSASAPQGAASAASGATAGSGSPGAAPSGSPPGAAARPAAAVPPGSAPADPELRQMLADYDAFRKSKRNFRNLVIECGETLQTNIQTLIDGKAFDNQAIMRVAVRLVDEIAARNLLLLAFHGMRYPGAAQIFHAMHAGAYGLLLAQALGYSRPKLQELMFAMLLMDCGMFRVPGHVREKNAELSEAERATIKTHPLVGYQLLVKNGKVKASLATVALQHHEAFDGGGYPQALKSGQIEESARIAAIADCYTAMIEKRAHRKAFLPYDAMKHMLSAQMNRFDPKMLRAFLGRISIYPLGSLVQLSNNHAAMVVACRPDKPLRPIVRLMRDDKGLPFSSILLVDLMKETDQYIVRALEASSAGVDLESET